MTLEPAELERAKAIVDKAQEFVLPEERTAYLDETCGGDATLRAEVERLLAAADEAGGFTASPAVAPAYTSAFEPQFADGPGTQIGPYKLLEQIGEGGFGLVFVAEQHRPVRRRVGLKIIKPGMDTRQVIARFEAERQALALMDHPNIAKVFDAGATDSGRPYFVMELVRGLPITQYCDEHQLTVRERLELFITLCRAIQHAHQKGIIHRDVKPTNVLVTLHDGRPVPKVIDFGVAKALSQQLTERTIYTQFAQMIGTPLYMSPEQAEMSGLDIDTRSDIYSLGVVLYELLTGTTPFERERLKAAGADEIRRIVREEEPPTPSARLSALRRSGEPSRTSAQGPARLAGPTLATTAAQRRTEPARLVKLVRGELDWIVMKCLEKDRNRRYDTANNLARDIERYLNDEPVRACPPSAAYRFHKFARRNKAALSTTIFVAASLVIVTFVSVWQSTRVESEHPAQDTGNALALAQNGQWEAAADAFQRNARKNPNDYLSRLRYATLQLYLGNIDEYRQTSRELVQRFADDSRSEVAERIARVCALAPQSVEDLAAITALIDRAYSHPAPVPGYQVWPRLAKGLVEYRSGRPEAAIEWLTSCNPLPDGSREYGNDTARDAMVYAGIALARHSLGEADAARDSLNTCRALIEANMPDFETRSVGGAPLRIGFIEEWIWYDWLHCLILVREAETLLEATTDTSRGRARQQLGKHR